MDGQFDWDRIDIVACGITFVSENNYWIAESRGLFLHWLGIDGWQCSSCLPDFPIGDTPESAVQQTLDALARLKACVLRNLGES
jgi:hypothetical protein